MAVYGWLARATRRLFLQSRLSITLGNFSVFLPSLKLWPLKCFFSVRSSAIYFFLLFKSAGREEASWFWKTLLKKESQKAVNIFGIYARKGVLNDLNNCHHCFWYLVVCLCSQTTLKMWKAQKKHWMYPSDKEHLFEFESINVLFFCF